MVSDQETYSTQLSMVDRPPMTGVAILAALDLSDDFKRDSVERWFHCLPFGTFVRNGVTRTHDASAMKSIIDNFRAHAMPLSLDYEHQTIGADRKNGPVATAGIIIGFGVGEKGLYALGKFTKQAYDLGRTGEINYCSPVVVYNGEDSLTGKIVPTKIYNIALTANPALSGLEPIKFTEELMADKLQPPPAEGTATPSPDAGGGAKKAENTTLQNLCDLVGCSSVGDLLPLIDAKADAIASILKGEDATALGAGCGGMSDAQKAAIAIAKGKEKMSDTIDTRDEQIAILSKQVELLTAESTAFKAEREAFAASQAKIKIDAKIESLYKEGRLVKDLEPAARELFSKDSELGDRIFASALVPTGTQAGPDKNLDTPRTKSDLNERQLELYSALEGSSIYARSSEQELITETMKLLEGDK